MEAIIRSVNNIFDFSVEGKYKGPTLALVAGNNRSFYEEHFSDSFPYIAETDQPWMNQNQ